VGSDAASSRAPGRPLRQNLADLADSLDLHLAMVSGDATRTSLGANDFNAILTRFAPRARNRPASDDSDEIDC